MIEEFFRRYERAVASGDSADIAACYGPSFLVAGPEGSGTFQNDASFLEWLRGVDEFNRRSGMTEMVMRRVVSEVTLSPAHTLATIEWAARFERTGERTIPFRIAYLVEHLEGAPKILAYVSEEDQAARMQELGVI